MGAGTRVSVVIPCYNAVTTVTRAIQSALVDGVDVEVVVVDDGSTDDSAEVVEQLGLSGVRLLRQENAGVCAARNAGATAASGTCLVFLDADDELLPGALARYVAQFDPEHAPIVRAELILQRRGSSIVQRPHPTDPRRPHPRGPKIPGSFAVSPELFQQVGGYVQQLRYGENTELLLRLALAERGSDWSTALIREPAVLVHREDEGRVERYDREPARAARYVFAQHGEHLAQDPAIVHDYRSIMGVDLLRHGDRRGARKEFMLAVRARPRSWRAWARVTRTMLPPIPDRRRDGRPLVAVVSPGAGRIRRGYEAFAIDIAEQLLASGSVRVLLLQGGQGPGAHVRRIPHLDRHGRTARLLSRLTRLYPTSIEHYSFGLCSLPILLWHRPDAVLLAERVLANLYGESLGRLGLGTRIVLRNGGSHRPPFRHVDCVIHHTPDFLAAALEDPGSARHVHLPYAFDLTEHVPVPPSDLAAERTRLGLPTTGPVVISVGAVDSTVKRMDHVITELAELPPPRPHLVILGQREPETPIIEQLAADLLEPGGVTIMTVAPEDVERHLLIADVFLLASPKEGFGRVYVEAMAAGLPCIVHDTAHTRWVLGPQGRFVDMAVRGALLGELRSVLADPDRATPELRSARHREMYERYSWNRLLPGYLDALGLREGS